MRAGRHRAATWTCAHLTLTFICFVLFASFATAKDDSSLSQSFSFDLTPKVPITAQCDTLHITWRTSKGESGPKPLAPFFLHVFSSKSDIPLIVPAGNGPSFDWPVPFAPFTEYEICMFDAANNTGGCQDIYTVYPALYSQVTGTPNCTNLTDTHPAQALGVVASTSSGPLNKTSTVDQCADISVLPTNGTPPYTLTISPTFRTPIIKTSDAMGPINETVSLSWGSSFFVSLADSSGMRWSAGPLHTGNGSSDCSDADEDKSKGNGGERKMHMVSDAASDSSGDGHHSDSHTVKVQIWAAAISIAGSVILGILLGLLTTLLYMRCSARRARKNGEAPASRSSKAIKRKDYAQRMSVQIPSPGQPRDEDDEDAESDDELGGSTVTGHPDWQEPGRRKAVSMDSMRSAGASRENVRTPSAPAERARRPPPSSFPTNPTLRRTPTPLPSPNPARRRTTPLPMPTQRRPTSLSTSTPRFSSLPRTPASTLHAPISAPIRKLPTPVPAPLRRLPAPPRPPRPAEDVLDISAPPRFGLPPRYNSPAYMGTRPTIGTQNLRSVRPLPTPPAHLQSGGESAWWV